MPNVLAVNSWFDPESDGGTGSMVATLSGGLRKYLKVAISGFLNNKIAYNIRPVLNLHGFWPVQIDRDICTLYFDTINCSCNPQKNQPGLRRA